MHKTYNTFSLTDIYTWKVSDGEVHEGHYVGGLGSNKLILKCFNATDRQTDNGMTGALKRRQKGRPSLHLSEDEEVSQHTPAARPSGSQAEGREWVGGQGVWPPLPPPM